MKSFIRDARADWHWACDFKLKRLDEDFFTPIGILAVAFVVASIYWLLMIYLTCGDPQTGALLFAVCLATLRNRRLNEKETP